MAPCSITSSSSTISFSGLAAGNYKVNYVVPSGYGTKPKAGTPIEVNESWIAKVGADVFYASVEEKDDRILTTTSRALAVVGISDSIAKAEAACEAGLRHVKGDVYVRHDIGTAMSIERKIERMKSLRSAA